MTPRMYPKNIEPVSPIKILAGLKLKGKNPKHAPMTAKATKAMSGLPSFKQINTIETEAMELTPAANPSSPSMKLTALIMRTIQSTEKGIASQLDKTIKALSLKKFGFVKMPMRIFPNTTTITAANI